MPYTGKQHVITGIKGTGSNLQKEGVISPHSGTGSSVRTKKKWIHLGLLKEKLRLL